MLIGNELRSVDEKHRVFMPKTFVESFPFGPDGNREVYITQLSEDRCLLVYSRESFQRAIEGLNTVPFAPLAEQNLATRILGATGSSPLDRQGRFKLPENLRNKAGIGEKVVLVGLVDRIELWSEEAYDRVVSGPPPVIAPRSQQEGVD